MQLVGVEHAFELARRQAEVGRTDRFVRFLRVLHARLIAARAVVVLAAEHLANHARRLVHRLVGQRRRVGAVIGDETFHLAVTDVDALEQPLRHLHRPLGGEPELAAGFLRQRRRRERRRRTLDARLLFDDGDGPRNVRANRFNERCVVGLVQQTQRSDS